MLFLSLSSHLVYNEYWGSANKTEIDKLIILQKKCLRLISHAHPLSHCLPLAKNLNILMINDLFVYNILVLMYSVHNLSCSPVFTSQFRKCCTVHCINTRLARLHFFMFPCHTNIRRNFIVMKGPTLWTSLSVIIRESCSLLIFNRNLRNDIYKS